MLSLLLNFIDLVVAIRILRRRKQEERARKADIERVLSKNGDK